MSESKGTEVRVVSKEEAAKMEPNLPKDPAARREELKKRADTLEAAAEELAKDIVGLSPEHFEIDREIARDIEKEAMDIGSNHPHLKTAWENYKNADGIKIWEAKSRGWRIASVKDFPEAKQFEKEDGSIRVGDVMLLCTSKENYAKQEERREKLTKQRFGMQIDDKLKGYADKKGVRIFDTESGDVPQHVLAQIEASRKSILQKEAFRMLGNRMKKGVIPGIPIK